MKFPRNARMLKGHLDFAPFASVFFCLLIFVLLYSLIYTPGVHIQLPSASPGLTGLDGGVEAAVALYPDGRLFYQNRLVTENVLKFRLGEKVRQSAPRPVTLVLEADVKAPGEQLQRVWQLANEAGITSIWLATLPGPVAPHPAK